jgi:hypothetical protein
MSRLKFHWVVEYAKKAIHHIDEKTLSQNGQNRVDISKKSVILQIQTLN